MSALRPPKRSDALKTSEGVSGTELVALPAAYKALLRAPLKATAQLFREMDTYGDGIVARSDFRKGCMMRVDEANASAQAKADMKAELDAGGALDLVWSMFQVETSRAKGWDRVREQVIKSEVPMARFKGVIAEQQVRCRCRCRRGALPGTRKPTPHAACSRLCCSRPSGSTASPTRGRSTRR